MNLKILILADIVFSPIEKELKKNVSGIDFEIHYYEDITLGLMTLGTTNLSSRFQLVYIHSDQYFHHKPIDWQKKFLAAINNLAASHPHTRFLVANLLTDGYSKTGLKNSVGSIQATYSLYSKELNALSLVGNLSFFDVCEILFEEGASLCYNFSLGILYQMPYSKKFIQAFSKQWLEYIGFLFEEEKKVIVLDCDNTLWKGIVGEDGLDGIQCDRNAAGISYFHLQQFLREKKHEGFLLCLCSKNNEADVKEVFEKKEMPLKWNDFIARKINWDEKSQNIKKIAGELNLGESSFIFIDDNPFELSSVIQLTGVLKGFQFEGTMESLNEITSSLAFRKKQILKADLEKNTHYQIEKERKEALHQFENFDEYLKSLEIKTSIKENDIADIDRLAQMTEKTNQFNFNKKAMSQQELRSWIDSGNLIFSIQVSDKFGDYGTVGLILISVNGSAGILENFLMSCRALGKHIEDTFFESVVKALAQKQIKLTQLKYSINSKNIPAITFVKKLEQNGYHTTQVE